MSFRSFYMVASLLVACAPSPELIEPQQSGLTNDDVTADERDSLRAEGLKPSDLTISSASEGGSYDGKIDPSALERAEASKCRFFDEDKDDLPFAEPFRPWSEIRADCEAIRAGGDDEGYRACMTNIGPMPPAEFPMPVHKTFERSGHYKGDDYIFIAMVDILITYTPSSTIYQDNYDGLYKAVIPGERESSEHERRVYEITIFDADDRDCEVEWEQVE